MTTLSQPKLIHWSRNLQYLVLSLYLEIGRALYNVLSLLLKLLLKLHFLQNLIGSG